MFATRENRCFTSFLEALFLLAVVRPGAGPDFQGSSNPLCAEDRGRICAQDGKTE
jgi:hypothetical protein